MLGLFLTVPNLSETHPSLCKRDLFFKTYRLEPDGILLRQTDLSLESTLFDISFEILLVSISIRLSLLLTVALLSAATFNFPRDTLQ